MEYDERVMVGSAQGLIRQGLEVKVVRTINHAAIGFVIGIAAAFVLAMLPATSFWVEALTPGLVITAATLIMAGIGFLRAVEEAKFLRFRAHALMCQVQIERHLSVLAAAATPTRSDAPAAPASPAE